MPLAERHGDKIVIHYELPEAAQLQLIPGARYQARGEFAKTWTLPLSWMGCQQLRGAFGDELQVGSRLAEWGRRERDERVEPCLALRGAEDSRDLSFLTRLRPFQRAGVKFLSTARQALLADEMGLGKTVQAIATLELLGNDAYPALVVVPNTMKFTWAEEYAKWAPSRTVALVNGSAKKRIEAIEADTDVTIINWESLRLHTRVSGYGAIALTEKDKTPKELNAIEWHSIVADEAHKAKDPKAQQTRALWYLGDHVNGGGARLMLTGTPVANSPEDIWSLMRFVAPREYPEKTRFLDRYAVMELNYHSGFKEPKGLLASGKDELFRVLDPRFLRRTKAAVLPQLPAKQYSTRYVELGTKQRKAYESMRARSLAELNDGILIATNPLTKMTRLLQFASAFGELTEDDRLLLTEPSCKVDALEELAAELGGESAVVFAESEQLIRIAHDRLAKAGYTTGLITGPTSIAERQANVKAFNSGQLQLLFLTLGAGGEGLSLQGSSTAVFLQRSFSLVKNLQAEDRLHGIGRGVEGEALQIIDLVALDTAEDRVHAARAEKAAKLEELCRDEATLRAWLAK